MSVAMALALSLVMVPAAYADTSRSDFEEFNLGTVNGQDGWKSALSGDIPDLPNGYDQAVVANAGSVPATFGEQSLRVSNAYVNGEFHFQTYSKPVQDPAGENATNKVLISEFTFRSTTPDAIQPGLAMSLSPTNAEGARMSYVRLEDQPDGIRVFFNDTPNRYAADFDEQWIATLDRAVPHTIRFEIKFVEGNANDIVKVYVDDAFAVCGTTWENYYRYVERDPAKAPAYVEPSDRLMWRLGGAGVPAVPELTGGGFLFDNVVVTTAASGGPAACPLPVGPAGPAGATGTPGTPGPATTTIIRETALEGVLGETRSKDVRRLVIKRNGATSVRKLKAWFEGKRLKIHRTANGRNWFVKANLSDLPRGTYAVRVHAIVNGHQFRQMHYYRGRYENPRGSIADSLNAYRVVKLV